MFFKSTCETQKTKIRNEGRNIGTDLIKIKETERIIRVLWILFVNKLGKLEEMDRLLEMNKKGQFKSKLTQEEKENLNKAITRKRLN